jgi:DNA helicase-2/ATP-dependent DNA helicase PcrA
MPPSWKDGVRGHQVLPLIELDAETIRVEAGPGTGKTFGLVRRVERILHPEGLGVRGQDVLVIAFNRVIARQLESAISERLGTFAHEGNPRIQTIHALCLQIVGEDLRILLPHEREGMIYDILTAHATVRGSFHTFDEADQALRNHEAGIEDHIALWQATREWLTRHGAQLISDLPSLFLAKLAAGDMPDVHYEHIIVDEFQDLTPGEQDLIFKLRRQGGQLIALGDPRQSIYRFRGNELQGLAKITEIVTERGEELVDIPLQECQRCPSTIVTAANRLMALSDAQELTPVNETPANLHVVVWESPMDEAEGMAQAVVDNFERFPADKHLVMTTRRQFGYWFRDRVAAIAPELNVELNFSESILETWAVREAFLFFSLVADPDAPTWRAWLGYRDSSTGKDYKAPRRNSDAYLRFLTSAGDVLTEAKIRQLVEEPRTKQRGDGGSLLWDRGQRYVHLKELLYSPDSTAEELVETIFNPDHWLGPGYIDADTARLDFDLLRKTALGLVTESREKNSQLSATDCLKTVVRHLRYGVGTREQFLEETPCDIQVTTLWGAKGVTADHVYILGVCDEAIPGKKREEYPGTEAEYIEEQKRLFYVSITRTKKTLVLSRARRVTRNEAMRLGLAVAAYGPSYVTLEMSQFLRDIIGVLPDGVQGRYWGGCES